MKQPKKLHGNQKEKNPQQNFFFLSFFLLPLGLEQDLDLDCYNIKSVTKLCTNCFLELLEIGSYI